MHRNIYGKSLVNQSSTTYITKEGLLALASPYQTRPNYKYNSTNNDWEFNGYINEVTLSTSYKSDFSGMKTQGTITVSTTTGISPYGDTRTLYLFNQGANSYDSSANQYYCSSNAFPLSGPSVYSMFVKQGTATTVSLTYPNVVGWKTFDFTTGDWTASSYSTTDLSESYHAKIPVVKLANGWFRIDLGMYVPGDGRGTPIGVGTTANGTFYMFGVNGTIESKPNYMSSYIPDAGVRNADNITDIGLYPNRSTIGTYLDAGGLLTTAQPYMPRPNYVYDGTTFSQRGFLTEVAGTNYAMNGSLNITGAYETVIGPDGQSSGIHLTAAAYASTLLTHTPITPPSGSTTVTYSYYVKIGQQATTCGFNLLSFMGNMSVSSTSAWWAWTSGTVPPISMTRVSNDWARIQVGPATINTSGSQTNAFSYSRASSNWNSDCYLYGFQIEFDVTAASSYIPTTTSSITRTSDFY